MRRSWSTRIAVGIWLLAVVALAGAVAFMAAGTTLLAAAGRPVWQAAVGAGSVVLLLAAGPVWWGARAMGRTLAADLPRILQWIDAAEGEHWEPLPVPEAGEWGELAYALNRMAARLALSSRQRDRFLASLAHELKTPLTVLAGNLEAIRSGVLQPDAARLAALDREVRRLGRLVDQLLLIESARNGQLPLHPAPYDARAQVEELLLRFQPLLETRQVRVETELAPVTVSADRDRLEQVLTNVFDNALRHTPAGGVIRLTLAPDGDGVAWAVEDSGPGIPPDLRDRVTEPFLRDPRSPGAGLGLAVAAALVTAHGGSLTVGTGKPGGARVSWRLPV
ncbi:MAG: ATP-binding protein [Firmicutes bacterium]|nr:ATP-binding protein [Bacillota bacterium]